MLYFVFNYYFSGGFDGVRYALRVCAVLLLNLYCVVYFWTGGLGWVCFAVGFVYGNYGVSFAWLLDG